MKFTKHNTLVVKGIAILIMLYYHLFSLIYNYGTFDVQFILPKDMAVSLSNIGNVCVPIFAFLASFGLTKKIASLEKEENIAVVTLKQYAKLLATFIPIYISSLLLFAKWLPISSVYGKGLGKYAYMLLDAIGVSNLFGGITYNPTWWYMSLAILIIFLTPLLIKIHEKIGNILMLLAALLPLFIDANFMINQYLFVIACGVCFAKGEYLEKCKAVKIGKEKWVRRANWLSKLNKVLLCTFAIIILVIFRQSETMPIKLTYYADQMLAIVLVYTVYEFLCEKKLFEAVFGFLGKHSANIYFVHTFFIIWAIDIKNKIFSLRYAPLIFLGTIGISLLYSIALEGCKRFFKFVKIKLSRKKMENA